MTREDILRLPPGPELDELACKAVGLEPLRWRAHNVSAGHVGPWAPGSIKPLDLEGQRIEYEWLPISTDPAATHQLAMAADENGIGYPICGRIFLHGRHIVNLHEPFAQ